MPNLKQEHLRDILYTIVNNIPYAVWLKDTAGAYVLVNKAYEDFYGIKGEEITSKNVMATLVNNGLTVAGTVEELINIDTQILLEGKTIKKDVIMNIDGQKRFVEIVKTPICDEEGIVLGLLGISHDVTSDKLAIETEKAEVEDALKLELAEEIQLSSLPQVFPPYTDRSDFDIYATLKPAKHVGGDFYDFYYVDENTFAFTIADVSNKGISAAMFMMKVKSILKSTVLTSPFVANVMEKVNDALYKNNDKWFFATIGLGIIDLRTGEVIYVNAGNTSPLLRKNDGAKFVDVPGNVAVGIFDDIEYEVSKIKLQAGDTLFLYSDGVVDAVDDCGEKFGANRLLRLVQKSSNSSKRIIDNVYNELEGFTYGVEQADDITMLALTYLGKENYVRKVFVPLEISQLDEFNAWLEECCWHCGISQEKRARLFVVAEEVFTNIANHAFNDVSKVKMPETTIHFKFLKYKNEVQLIFSDNGVRYNPLNEHLPDVEAYAEDRAPGGLGILMLKKMSDGVEYDYLNNKNMLTVKFEV